jgi:hypothetical protein
MWDAQCYSYVTLTSAKPAEIRSVACDLLSPDTVCTHDPSFNPLLYITLHYPGRTLDVTIWLTMHAMNFRSSWNTAWNYKRFRYEQIALHRQRYLLNMTERPTALDSQCHLQRNCCNILWAGAWMTTTVYNYIHTYIHSKLLFTQKEGPLKDCAGAANIFVSVTKRTKANRQNNAQWVKI